MKNDLNGDRASDDKTPFGVCHSEGEPPVITVDYEAYAHFLDDAELSEAEKRALLQSLWNVIVDFVSLGFGVHPLQQVQGHAEADTSHHDLSATNRQQVPEEVDA